MTDPYLCAHPAVLSVTGRPGVTWCPTCGTTLITITITDPPEEP